MLYSIDITKIDELYQYLTSYLPDTSLPILLYIFQMCEVLLLNQWYERIYYCVQNRMYFLIDIN